MHPSRRNLLKGIIAAPAILKLGLYMPVKTIVKPAEPMVTRFVHCSGYTFEFTSINGLLIPDKIIQYRSIAGGPA